MDYCSSPKVLLLGISYPDVYGHMKAHSYEKDVLQISELSVDQAVECVRRKILTEMDGRDLARCVATEEAGGGHEVYTVSKEMGGIYRDDRHVYASFNNSRGMRKAMHNAFGHVRFQQVILDYYWMPTGWLVTRWNKTLFQETLPDLVKYDMLAYPGSRGRSPKKKKSTINRKNNHNKDNIYNYDLELEEGVVFLPFCAHVCKELVGGIDKLKPYYAITFVKKSELPGHALWKGTMTIDGNVMQHRLGKRLDQEEVYCTFQPKDIYESMEDAHVKKDDVMEMLLSIEDFENIRMIRLRPLRQHEPPSLFRKTVVEPETGGFIGLNREKGRKRFKEYRKRGKNKPLPPPQALPRKTSKAKASKTKPVKSKTNDSDSDVHSSYSDSEDTYIDWDADSDSSSDEEGESQEDMDEEKDNKEKMFDPYDGDRIPQTTLYFPYPALDIQSYMISKGVVTKDEVMAYYAKQWGPKCSRKKNKKQDIAKQDFKRFKEKQRDYMSYNPRMPILESEREEGYRWTLVGSDDERESESEWEEGNKKWKRRNNPGWNLSLKGDDPDAHREPKIVQLAKRDYERNACLHLFEMKNPGYKKLSRTWANNKSYMCCYKIPKESVLIKIDAAEKAKRKREAEMEKDGRLERRCDEDEWESVYSKNDSIVPVIDEATRTASSELYRLADIAATAPILTNDFRLICENSRLIDEKPRATALPPFKPKKNFKPLLYNLDPHENFPRELFQLLQDAEERILDHIVCWQESGRSFIVKEHDAFEKVVLFNCCKDTNSTYQSFLATILSYGFVEIRVGKRQGGYRHNLFQRGKPKRLDELIREGTNNVLVNGNAKQDYSIGKSRVEKRIAATDKPCANMFVKNLYQILRKSHSLGLDDAIHWEEGGKSFKVHKLNEKFDTKVLKVFLSMTRYKRFKEELMDRGFRCREGKKYGIFEHPNFIRGQRGVSNTFEDINLQRRNITVIKKQKTEFSSDPPATRRRRKRETGENSMSSSDTRRQSVATKSTTGRKRKAENGQKSVPSNDPNRQSVSTKSPTTRKRKIKQNSVSSNEMKPQRSSTRKRQASIERKSGSKHPKKESLATNGTKKQCDIEEASVAASNTSHNVLETAEAPKRPRRKASRIFNLTYKYRVPRVMHDILEECTKEGLSETIRWLPEGNSFFVNKKLFTDFLLRRTTTRTYFTFEGYMKGLGFEITDCSEGGSIFKHEHFVRGQNHKFARWREAQAFFHLSGNVPLNNDSRGRRHSKRMEVTKIEMKNLKPSSSMGIASENDSPNLHKRDVIQTNSSPPESENLHNSPENENSHLRLGTAISPTDDKNATGNHCNKTSPGTIGSPGLPTEKQSPVETPKAKESTKNFHNTILAATNAITKAVASRGPSRGKGRLKKASLGSKARPAHEGPANSKKRKITTSPANKSIQRRKKGFSTTGISVSAQDLLSLPYDRNTAPSTKRGLLSSDKVCGTNTMVRTKASTLSKYKIQDKVSRNRDPRMLNGKRHGLTALPTGSSQAARSVDIQIMRFNPSALPSPPRLEISIPQESRREIKLSSKVRTNSITITPPSGSIVGVPTDGKVVDEQLRSIGLTFAVLQDLLSLFSSSFGKNRAQTLEAIIFWQAGIPIPPKNEIEQLDSWIPASPKPNTESAQIQQLLKRSLTIEVCSTELRRLHGVDWHQHLAVLAATFPLHSAVKQLRSEVMEISDHFSSTINSSCQQLMNVVMEYKMSELRERTILEMKEKEHRLKNKLAELVTQQHTIAAMVERNEVRQQGIFLSHGSPAIGNSPESIVRALHQHATQRHSNQPQSPATPQRGSRGLFSAIVNYFQPNQNGVSGGETPVRNRSNTRTPGNTPDQNYCNNNSPRSSLMEQIRLHHQHQGQQSSLGFKTYFQR